MTNISQSSSLAQITNISQSSNLENLVWKVINSQKFKKSKKSRKFGADTNCVWDSKCQPKVTCISTKYFAITY